MSKVEKPSNNSASDPDLGNVDGSAGDDFDFGLVDLNRVAEQHLGQLKRFGISFLPGRTGQTFEIPQFSADEEPESQPTTEKPAGKAAEARRPAASNELSTQPNRIKPSIDIRSGDPAQLAAPAPTPLGQSYSKQVSHDPIGDLNIIASEVAACTKCPELVECRSQTVFGVGNPKARLVLIGDAPEEQEDKQGEPFVGAAGQLLDKMLAACGLNRRDDVYILNAIKCRPPANRNPKSEELDHCWHFAQRQLEILQPEFICCLGSIAARTLLQSKDSVGRLRKKFHVYRGSKVLVTYHPSYLLRTTSAKRHAWEDMQMLMKEMGIQIPSR